MSALKKCKQIFILLITGKVFGNEDPGGSKGLLKWKGVMFAPDDEESENKQNGSVKETLPVTCAEGDEVIEINKIIRKIIRRLLNYLLI